MSSLEAPTYAGITSMYAHFKLLNGDPETLTVLLATGVTPASFATWLAGAGKTVKFTQLMASPNGAGAVAASSTAMTAVAASSTAMTAVIASSTAMTAVAASRTAMTAVIASSTAMTAVIASSTAMTAVAASSTAMTAVIASSTAMTAVAASSTAKMAIYNSDTALAAIAASGSAVAAMRAATAYLATAGIAVNGGAEISVLNAAGSYIMLGLSSGNAPSGQVISVATRRSGSSVVASGLTVPSQSAVPTTLNLAIPVKAPFSASSSSGYTWYFGFIRCDI